MLKAHALVVPASGDCRRKVLYYRMWYNYTVKINILYFRYFSTSAKSRIDNSDRFWF